MADSPPGKLIIVSGPSGAGKSTLLERLFDEQPGPLAWSVSATTRAPRQGEIDGQDYYFLSHEEFARRRAAGDFLECFEVYPGCWYGTLRSEVTPSLEHGKWVVLEIDVRGTLAVLEEFPDALTIFVRPASLEDLERRLRTRGTESAEAVARRLEVARAEWMQADRYRFQVVNDSLDEAAARLRQIITQQR